MEAPAVQLDQLPPEIVFKILLNADLKTILKYCQTSRAAAAICDTPSFWLRKYRQDYGEPTPLLIRESWRGRYIGTYGLLIINSPISIGGSESVPLTNTHYGVIDDQGELSMAGDNTSGQLGVTGLGSILPRPVTLLKQKVVSVHCDYMNTSAVTKDGKVYVWGYRPQFGAAGTLGLSIPQDINFEGRARKVYSHRQELGIIADDFSAYHISWIGTEQVMETVKFPIKAIDIAFTDRGGFYLISRGGDLYRWILRAHFKGPGDQIKLRKIELPEPVKQISLDMVNLGVLSVTGKIYQLSGLNLRDIEITTPNIPGPVSLISFRYDIKAAVTTAGKLYMWGNNAEQRISGDIGADKEVLSPVEIGIGRPVTSVASGSVFTLAVTSDGVVNYWGTSEFRPPG